MSLIHTGPLFPAIIPVLRQEIHHFENLTKEIEWTRVEGKGSGLVSLHSERSYLYKSNGPLPTKIEWTWMRVASRWSAGPMG